MFSWEVSKTAEIVQSVNIIIIIVFACACILGLISFVISEATTNSTIERVFTVISTGFAGVIAITLIGAFVLLVTTDVIHKSALQGTDGATDKFVRDNKVFIIDTLPNDKIKQELYNKFTSDDTININSLFKKLPTGAIELKKSKDYSEFFFTDGNNDCIGILFKDDINEKIKYACTAPLQKTQ